MLMMEKTGCLFFICFFMMACAPSFKVADTGKSLEYRYGKKSLFTYNYMTVYPPGGVDTVFKRSGFIHPLKDLHGNILTNLFPGDHYHHYGLWYAWTRTFFEGEEIDFWNVGKRLGTVRFQEFSNVTDSGFEACLEHVAYPETDRKKTVMKEKLNVCLGKSSGSGYFMDYVTELECATTSPVELAAYRYGGLVIRTASDWIAQGTEMMTSEGLVRKNADNSEARWCYFQKTGEETPSCILILSYPRNLYHPESLRVWDETANNGTGEMMWNFSPTRNRAFTLKPENKLELRYRIWILNERIGIGRAEELWQEFVQESFL
jgi:hypothetical protein